MVDRLDRSRIDGVVRAMGERLQGDWLLIDGAAIAMWLSPRRVTEDLDVLSMSGNQSDRFSLMDLAEELGLPTEALNSAADFFVHRIPGWRQQLELLHAGSQARIFRPNATLMLLLKIRRLSARDMEDCELVLATPSLIDVPRVSSVLAQLPATEDQDLLERRTELAALLAARGAG